MQNYISKELTHFVGRGRSEKEQFELLLQILKEGWLTHAPHNPNWSGNLRVNPNAKISENEMYVPQMVCFCDIPIHELSPHMRKYSSFGISFLKSYLIPKGVTPVYYIAKNSVANVLPSTFNPPSLSEVYQKTKEHGVDAFFEQATRSKYFDDMLRIWGKLEQRRDEKGSGVIISEPLGHPQETTPGPFPSRPLSFDQRATIEPCWTGAGGLSPAAIVLVSMKPVSATRNLPDLFFFSPTTGATRASPE